MRESDLKPNMKVQNTMSGEQFTFLRMDPPFALCRDSGGDEVPVHPSKLEPDGRHR